MENTGLRVLVVEDDRAIRELITLHLKLEGYGVVPSADGAEALRLARAEPFDLIVLDIMLPGRDGLSICRNLRASGISTPIILLTAKGREADKIRGLDLGADDYVTKPFARGELLARVRAALRRSATPAGSLPAQYTFGGVTVDFARHQVSRAGQPFDLTPIEFKLLQTFIENRDHVLTHDEIIEHVWGREAFLTDRVLYTHVNNLRGKIEATPSEPRFLTGVRGVGYRFDG